MRSLPSTLPTTLTGGLPNWRVENGYLEVGTGDIMTFAKFGPDFELHAEFWLPLMADRRGQARANSGSLLFMNGTLTNYRPSTSTLTGGVYNALSGTIELSQANKGTGAVIATNAATILLDGAPAKLADANGNNILQSFFSSNSVTGDFTLQHGANLTSASSDFTNAGAMTIAEQYDWHQSYLRRHPVSRRTFLRCSAAAAGVAALGVSPFGRRTYAEDAPLAVANRRVGYGADAASQLRFAAQMSRNHGNTKVFLDHGPTPALRASTEAEVRNLITQIPAGGGGVLAAAAASGDTRPCPAWP